MTIDQDPSKWKWGMFYYNIDDPRSLVPNVHIKGLSWALNFAQPGTIIFILIFTITYSLIR